MANPRADRTYPLIVNASTGQDSIEGSQPPEELHIIFAKKWMQLFGQWNTTKSTCEA
jgi:hypothetical protein